MTYQQLIVLIAQITHRDDLATQRQDFVDAANEMIETRLTLSLKAPGEDVDNNFVFTQQPYLYVYASLIGAYEFINEIDMAEYYTRRFDYLIEQYYINSKAGEVNSPVMGEGVSEDVDIPVDPVTAGWILETGYWNDQGIWVDAAQWID